MYMCILYVHTPLWPVDLTLKARLEGGGRDQGGAQGLVKLLFIFTTLQPRLE